MSISHINTDSDSLLRSRDLALVELNSSILEAGITLSIAEGVPRRGITENVRLAEDEGSILILVAWVSHEASGVEVVVENWEIAHVTGETDG